MCFSSSPNTCYCVFQGLVVVKNNIVSKTSATCLLSAVVVVVLDVFGVGRNLVAAVPKPVLTRGAGGHPHRHDGAPGVPASLVVVVVAGHRAGGVGEGGEGGQGQGGEAAALGTLGGGSIPIERIVQIGIVLFWM